jgi:hypothetical protein
VRPSKVKEIHLAAPALPQCGQVLRDDGLTLGKLAGLGNTPSGVWDGGDQLQKKNFSFDGIKRVRQTFIAVPTIWWGANLEQTCNLQSLAFCANPRPPSV